MTRRPERWIVDRLVRELGAERARGPLLVLWRWRWEETLLLTLGLLMWATSWVYVLLGLGVLAAVFSSVPILRRFLVGRFWCVITQHRLRAGFRETNVRSWSGRRPAILWTSARQYGQRILVSCPAGVDASQIEAVRTALAAACWAEDIRVERHARYANLVIVLVLRTSSVERGEQQ